MSELKEFRDLLIEKTSFVQLAIVKENGEPHVSPVWFDLSEEDLQNNIININTAKGRVKANNLKNGSSVAMVIMDPENPYRYLGIEGKIMNAIEGDVAENHIDLLAKKYLNKDKYPYRKDTEVRIKLQVKVEKVHKS
ncbi:MAG: hypothetical protein HeimC2_39020 [Candidatus Heimdallarchaeota archaeon LC_2]|nr:MAG: hypothetical protein HeimC2_39020 [Candidatus Heimdallarchaeota archaeon LC_2]